MRKTVISVICTIIAGLIGIAIEFDFDIPNASVVIVVAVMGGFIMNELRKK